MRTLVLFSGKLPNPHHLQGLSAEEQCIRSWLDSNKACPSCNEPATEGGVRRNRALEEITEAWDSARSATATRLSEK
jgi:hypothetical protein